MSLFRQRERGEIGNARIPTFRSSAILKANSLSLGQDILFPIMMLQTFATCMACMHLPLEVNYLTSCFAACNIENGPGDEASITGSLIPRPLPTREKGPGIHRLRMRQSDQVIKIQTSVYVAVNC